MDEKKMVHGEHVHDEAERAPEMKDMEHAHESEHREHGTEHKMHEGHEMATHKEHTGHEEHEHIHEEHAGHEGHKHSHAEHHRMMMEDFKKRFIISAILTIPILFLSPLIQRFLGFTFTFRGDHYVLFALSAIVYFYGGWPFLNGMIEEFKKKLPGMMTLIALAITVAFSYSVAVTFGLPGKTFYWELATLIDIMLLGHYIEMRSVLGASRALEELIKLMPTEAHLVTPEGIKDVPVSELKKGDIVLVKPGEKIPSDGIIIEGETSVNEAMLTGESKPVYKKPGDTVIGGSINLEGAIKVRIEKTGKDTYLMQVVELVRQAQETRSRTQDLANRAAFYLTLIAITAGTITLGTWLYLGKPFVFALERMVTVMVITCPHALGLAVPLVVSVSTSISAKKGILIRNREAFERAKDVQVVVFDKTGTLTEGKFEVTDIIALDELGEEEILKYAAALESHSSHPIAQGIVEKAKELGLEVYEVSESKVLPGKGVKGVINGKEVLVVSPGFLKENGLWREDERVNKVLEQGKTVVFLVLDGKLVGALALADKIRPESREAVKKLHEMGIKAYMLTGDNAKVAKWVAEELGLDGFFAEVLPHQKSEKIKELQEQGYTVAMVGDGINDAPALIQADVGIAIGAGTDVAIESADIILVKNDPRDVITAIHLARATYKKMVQNLAWATGYNTFAIPLAAGVLYNYGVLLSPAVGALLMSLSTVIVAINAKFLKV
ncbi:heavy metal translocating P-type ATPase [Thermococcus barophilus]|uniref:Lead/cadmium/zinc and mercury transporting ATPase n=1 Tax=Thermococcus barophilus (strain DSM 11836 / MP) TaxID=391623 RepID=F0LHW3_THEBM|nr:heavy metal translocating P-type ATPase [Thermococcus barophilus]ADT84363.1 lead/cadmium/zinc and mercury transporting ATPase [Thermococcus barophilus MP]